MPGLPRLTGLGPMASASRSPVAPPSCRERAAVQAGSIPADLVRSAQLIEQGVVEAGPDALVRLFLHSFRRRQQVIADAKSA